MIGEEDWIDHIKRFNARHIEALGDKEIADILREGPTAFDKRVQQIFITVTAVVLFERVPGFPMLALITGMSGKYLLHLLNFQHALEKVSGYHLVRERDPRLLLLQIFLRKLILQFVQCIICGPISL